MHLPPPPTHTQKKKGGGGLSAESALPMEQMLRIILDFKWRRVSQVEIEGFAMCIWPLWQVETHSVSLEDRSRICSGNAVNSPTDEADRREFEWVKLTLVFHLLICCTLQVVMSGGASMNVSYISMFPRMVHEEEEDTSSRDGVQHSLTHCFLFTWCLVRRTVDRDVYLASHFLISHPLQHSILEVIM